MKRPPSHYNPSPMFGERRVPSRTEQAIAYLLERAGGKLSGKRLALLLYMADVLAREYIGRPITDIRWTRDMLEMELDAGDVVRVDDAAITTD